MNTATTITAIWENATVATGCLADAIIKLRDDPATPPRNLRADLAEAQDRLAKASLELRQLQANLR